MIPSKIVTTYAENTGISVEQSMDLYRDLEHFFDRVVDSGQMLFPSDELDSAWHNFILYTRTYFDFCHTKYGRIVHHTPMKTPSGFADCGATCSAE
jgi:hypothetical protein